MLFYKEHKNVLGDVPLIQKHLIVSEKWNALSEEERNEYKEKRLSLQDESFNLNDKVSVFSFWIWWAIYEVCLLDSETMQPFFTSDKAPGPDISLVQYRLPLLVKLPYNYV